MGSLSNEPIPYHEVVKEIITFRNVTPQELTSVEVVPDYQMERMRSSEVLDFGERIKHRLKYKLTDGLDKFIEYSEQHQPLIRGTEYRATIFAVNPKEMF